MKSTSEPIHKWDRPTLLKAFLFGAVAEAVAIAPALLSPWGHAGPEGLLAWASVFFHLPSGFLLNILKTAAGFKAEESLPAVVAELYLMQTLIIGYVAFVWLRWKKLKAGGR